MDRPLILALYDRELRIDIEYPGLKKEVTGGVVRFSGPPEHQSGNFVLFSRFGDASADQVITEQISYYHRRDAAFDWKVYEHDSPPDLRTRLVQRGFFKPNEQEAVMVMNVREAPQRLLRPPHVEVRRLTNIGELSRLTELLFNVYGLDFAYLERLLADDLEMRPYYTSVYMAYVDDQPAAAGWIQFPARSQFASLWGGTVLPAFRGRGLYRCLIAARLQEAIRRGYSLLAIEAPRSHRGLAEHLGFTLLTYAYTCMWQPS